jgi:cell division septation protein DedD
LEGIKFSFFIFIFFLLSVITISAQSVTSTNYYVVIGEFKQLDAARKLTEEANLKTFHAHFMLDDKKQQYLVYLLRTSDQKKAKLFLKQIRKETEYKKARLYKGNQVEFK